MNYKGIKKRLEGNLESMQRELKTRNF